MVLRRITIDSTRLSVAVTPFARWVLGMGHSAKVAPEPPAAWPFQARQLGATASRVNRALYGRKNLICKPIPTKYLILEVIPFLYSTRKFWRCKNMNFQIVIGTAILSALVSGAVSLITTLLTVSTTRRKERFDRLFKPVNDFRNKINEYKLIAAKNLKDGNTTPFDRIMKNMAIQDTLILAFVENKIYLDLDLFEEAEKAFLLVARAEANRIKDEEEISTNMDGALETYGAYLHAFEKFEIVIAKVFEEQSRRLQKV
jgi:hypothetical protein